MDYTETNNPINGVEWGPLPELPIEENQLESIIKVIGVGGGGSNAVNHMFRKGIKDVSFVVCNTDNQALAASPVPNKIKIGDNTTAGLGAGGRPEVAKEAAEESIERIRVMLGQNTRMAFITAGMGGGTGTGASPVVARVAQEMGILTVGIVTIPFAFEGTPKIMQALKGVAELSQNVDALLVINNEKLREVYPDLNLANAFAKADDVLSDAAKAIAEIITVTGYINTDFADVYNIMKNGNVAIMNTGYAAGENRIAHAIKDALDSPLVNTNDVTGAKKILLSLYCSTEHQIRMEEVEQINHFMATVGENVEVIWGATFDDTLGEEVKITIIATGFDVSNIPGMPVTLIRNTSVPEASINESNVTNEPVNEMERSIKEMYGRRLSSEPEVVDLDGDFDPFGTTMNTEDLDDLTSRPAYLR